MRQKVKLSFNIVYVIVGCILIGFAVLEKLDSFWSGMGSALMVVGIINLLKFSLWANNYKNARLKRILNKGVQYNATLCRRS